MAHPIETLNCGLAEVKAYHRDGFLHLCGVFAAAEVAAMHTECDRLLASDLVHEDNLRTRFRTLPDCRRQIEKFDPVTDASPVFARIAGDERIVGVVRALFGCEPELLKDKVIFKEAGQPGYGPHQDFTWWQPFPPEKLLSVMVAIDGADASNGALELVPGRHDRHLTPAGELRGLSAEDLEREGLDDWRMVETQAGDLVIFHCLAPHRSGANTSDRSRRQFYPSYIAGAGEDVWRRHYEHYRGYVEAALGEDERGRLFLR